jgi:copper transport protein
MAFYGLRGTPANAAIALGIALVLSSFIVSGHAASTAPRWAAVPAWLVHVAFAIFWIGSLVPLLDGLRSRNGAFQELRKFSSLAVIAVPLLIAAGIVMAVLQVRHTSALIETRYGLLLMAKLVLVAALLFLAAWNRLWLLPARANGIAQATRTIKGTIAVELILGIGILSLTAVLSHEGPPRSTQRETKATGPIVVKSSRGRMATIALAREGDRHVVTVNLTDASGSRLRPLEVMVEFRNPEAGLEAISRPMRPAPDGSHRYEGRDLAIPGAWTVRVHALITDFERETFGAVVEVP